MAQLSYNALIPVAFAGMKADAAIYRDFVESKINADSVSIPFGVFVAQGGSIGDPGAILPAGSGAVLLGLLVHAFNYARTWTDSNGTHGELDSVGLVPGAALNVMVKGRMYVTVEEAVAIGDPVFVRYSANGGNTQKGAVRKSDDAGHTINLGKGRFVSSQATPGGLAIIEIDMTA